MNHKSRDAKHCVSTNIIIGLLDDYFKSKRRNQIRIETFL